ncbi:macrophage mannose receptor 1-like [Megalobrama amblycephala]|uniref:macrophage mannose receptor 1-like n=1 Tax=Megalobrama amblycephala TaxID=75352 RepID=UPI0020141ABA|nr:macrophage mannose receptor 1-like [Megalobrama amblycephala]
MTMIFLSLLLLLWGVPLSNASGRLRSFHLINEQQMSINEARKTCKSNYTDLVTIYNDEENSELVNFLKKSSLSTGWIGASSCKWSNHNLVTFTNISSNFTEENCCGAINTDGEWECFNCSSTKIYFMCYDQEHQTTNGSCSNRSCINGSNNNKSFSNESCINGSSINESFSNGSLNYRQQSYNYSLIRENKTWFEAQLYCRKNHTDLVTIRNYEENERVKEARNGSNSFWIGLQYNTNVDWLDGGHSNHTQNTKSKGCFTFLSMHGFWVKSNRNGCSALCYKSLIYVSPVKKSWEDALIYCHRHYSGLLRIESESDQKEIQRELRRKDISGPVWVGLRQSRLFGFWMWSDGLHVGHWTNWKVGSQTEHLISQHCGATEEVDGEYKWSDKDCRSEFTFLCEVK